MVPLIQRMSTALGVSIFTLAELCRTASYRYKVFTIPKRSGEPRTIAQPARSIKKIQRWLVTDELHILPVHKAAVAYKTGSSIKENAQAHSGGAFLLKMDFTEFFPSIGDKALNAHLKKYGQGRWDEQEIAIIQNLVLWLPKRTKSRQLCIGGPSSPFISNTLMFDFDSTLAEFCETNGVVYTRYADDLAFSTSKPNVLVDVERKVAATLEELVYPQLRLNDHKTVRTSRAGLRRVTGLKITPEGQISVGRERKREIRAKMHHFVRGLLTQGESLTLKGLLAFCLDAEPEFVKRLKDKFGEATVRRLLSQPSTPRKGNWRKK